MPSKGKINNDAVTQKQQKNLALPVTSLNLPSRATNALTCDGVHTVAQLVQRTEANLLGTPNFGRLSLASSRRSPGASSGSAWYSLRGHRNRRPAPVQTKRFSLII